MAIAASIQRLVDGLTALDLPNMTWTNSRVQAGMDRWGTVRAADGVSRNVTPYTLAMGCIVYFNGLTQDEFDVVHRYILRGTYGPHRRVRLGRWAFMPGSTDKFSGYITLHLWTSDPPVIDPDETPAAEGDLTIALRDEDGNDLGTIRG